ncbi:MAG: tandem-95 repeat protein, partial [Acidobacteria bacterium]|nr:tandem-95 repeat protein [Acidobacteriota bacterium]
MKHFTQQTPSRRNVRVFIATLLSYLMLVGQVAPLALASNNSGLRAAPAAKAEGTAAGEVQGLNAAPEPAPLAPPATTVTATKTDSFPNHGDGKAAPGDEITYAVNVSATGGDATNVQFTDSVGANTTFVPGSVTMSPLARNDAYTATAGTPLTVPAGGVLSNDSGLPAPSAVAISNGPTTKGGTVTLNTDGSFTYTQPAGAFSGTDSFTYTATNSNSPDDTATVTIDFNPGAAADSATVNEDSGATAIDVLANDPDPDGGSKSINSVTQPANGTVVITGGGTGLTYQPNANYCNDGSPLDTFTYTLTPGGSTATVSVTVTCVDDAPVAVNDSATVVEDSGANAVDVLANDTDIDGGPKSVVSVTQPANGTVVITGGGTGLTYQPNANYCNNPPGSTLDTFTYTLAPGGSSATVTMTVTCVDDAPVAVNDSATVVEDSGSNSIDVLANDTDTDGGPKSIASVTQPANGTVVITGGGTGLTYQPNANYCNNPPGTTPDTFTYTLTPGSSSATVSVTVTCVDDNPVAVNDSATVSEDSGATGIDVLLNDTDIDGGPKSVASVTQPANGTVVITGGGAGLTYAPNANYCNNPPGTTLDTFTYMLTPGGSSATVTVTVTCVNDGPVIDLDANDDKGTSGSDFAATFVPGGAASLIEDSADASVSDVDNTTLASLTVTITNLLDSGKETLSADVTGTSITANYAESAGAGTLTLTGPDTVANFQQVLRTVKYQDTAASPNTTARVVHFVSNDGTSDGNTAVSTVSFDQPPTAVNDSSTVNEDSGANTINVLANDTDPDGGPKSITSVTQPANGTVAITNSGADLTYTPNANYCNNPPGSALDTFTYTLSPGGSTATVTMTVTCANDAPTVDPATFSLNENSPNGTAVGTVTYSDVDNPAAGQTHTCAITAGNTGGAFAINPSTCAITVANSAAVNFETTPTFSLTVTVTDNGTPNLSGSNTITVNLNDVNEAPVVNPATFAIAENSANGTSVGTVTYSDPDAGQTKTCAITAGNTGTAFAIDPSTCAITVNNSAALDFETTPTFSLTVQVTDNGTPNLSGTATITVNLSNANESPTANPDTASVTEAGGVNNGTAGTNITSGFNVITGTGTGSVADTDPDAGDTLTIKGVAGGNQGNTVLSSNVGSGITSSNNYGTLTLSSNGSYTYVVNQTNTTVQGLRTSGDTATDVFTYTLRDAAGLTSNTTITITIHGANDNPVAV